MFTNTNIHDELGDDFTGATAMSNAEVKLALAHNRAQAPNKKRQSETFVRAEKHTKRVAQSNVIQIRSVLEQTDFSHFEKAQLANFCPPRNPARPQTADLNDAVKGWDTYISSDGTQRSFVQVENGVTTIVTGTLEWSELASFAATLSPVDVPAAP